MTPIQHFRPNFIHLAKVHGKNAIKQVSNNWHSITTTSNIKRELIKVDGQYVGYILRERGKQSSEVGIISHGDALRLENGNGKYFTKPSGLGVYYGTTLNHMLSDNGIEESVSVLNSGNKDYIFTEDQFYLAHDHTPYSRTIYFPYDKLLSTKF